jgi:hypothetical protein
MVIQDKIRKAANQLATVRDWMEIPEETQAGINGVIDELNGLSDPKRKFTVEVINCAQLAKQLVSKEAREILEDMIEPTFVDAKPPLSLQEHQYPADALNEMVLSNMEEDDPLFEEVSAIAKEIEDFCYFQFI